MRTRAALRLTLALMGLLAWAQAANAACSGPAASAGDMTYSSIANTMVYCDGNNWISMAGGVSLTVNTSGGGVTPYGVAGDVQINGGGTLSGDTGNFKYSASTLSTPIISASTGNITTMNSNAINNTGLGTFGSILDNGGLTVLGVASITTVSTTTLSATYTSSSLIQVGTGAGAACSAGLNGAIRYNNTSNTIDVCVGTAWTSLASGTITGSGVSGGSATAVAFWNGASSLTYESATTSGLYWDTANKRLGIGTNGPQTGIHLVSSSFAGASVRVERSGAPISSSFDIGASSGGTLDFDNVPATGAETYLASIAAPGNNRGFATLQVSGTFTVSQTGQNSLASASLAVDNRGISVSTILHMAGSPISYIGAGGNAILSGTTAVSTSSAGSITFYTGGSQQMVINPGGSVGIGISNPQQKFQVNTSGASWSTARLSNGVSNFDLGIAPDGSGQLIEYGAYPIAFWVNSNERMRIDSSGNVGVGTATPSANPNPGVSISPVGGINIGNKSTDASGWSYINFWHGGTFIGNISQNGTTGVTYYSASDRRLKENIVESRAGLEQLMALPVREFDFRADPSHTVVRGFIAQEVQKVFPEAVSTNGDDGMVPLKKGERSWSVDYGRITPLVVKAVQELKHLFDAEHDEISGLKADNDSLRILVGSQQRQIDALTAANDNAVRRLEKLEGRAGSR